jgi:hypothetical protein
MSNEQDMNETDDIQIFPLGNCKFAYTINSQQPVRCTWISDQPLFYSNIDEDALTDELLSDDPIFKALERDILELRSKTSAYEALSSDFIKSSDEKFKNFVENATTISKGTKAKASFNVMEYLHQSRSASMLLSYASTHNITLKPSSQVNDAIYDRADSAILYRADLSMADQALAVVRELRRVYHHKQGAGLHPLALHPDHAILVHRAQNADLSIAVIRAAWELQLSGSKEAWIRIESSTLNDIGRAFAREACSDFRSINNGTAAKAAFETWFLSERCRKMDRVLIQQMLADYQGYVFADNPEASRFIAGDVLNVLGQMPFGANYLSAYVNEIMLDPVFTDVRDRSNANFLWFIKFERTFKDAETELDSKQSKTTKTKSSDTNGAVILEWRAPVLDDKVKAVKKARQGSNKALVVPFSASISD